MKTKKETQLLNFGGLVLGGLFLVTAGLLIYCLAGKDEQTQMVVNQEGKLQEIEIEN